MARDPSLVGLLIDELADEPFAGLRGHAVAVGKDRPVRVRVADLGDVPHAAGLRPGTSVGWPAMREAAAQEDKDAEAGSSDDHQWNLTPPSAP